MGGTFPANAVVYRHTPRLPRRSNEGMGPLENRTTILQYYQAFKVFFSSSESKLAPRERSQIDGEMGGTEPG